MMHRKQKPRQKPRLPVGVVAMDSQSAVFENIYKTVFACFTKLVQSGLWKFNVWNIVIISLFCLFEQFEPDFSIHAPTIHRASRTFVSLNRSSKLKTH